MSRLSNQLVATMLANKISPQPFEALVDAALREDLGNGLDATTVIASIRSPRTVCTANALFLAGKKHPS